MESFTKTATSDMEKEIMRDTNIRFEKLLGRGFAATVAFATFALLLAGCAQVCLAQQPGTKPFSSAEEASHALYLAVQSDNEEAMTKILGAGKELVSLDDKVQDKLERERFTRKYQEMHRLVREPDATTVLYIGAENWPFPIPLVSENGAWHFDAKIGMEEVLFRRIGENEVTAIEACHTLVAAEKEHKRLMDHPSRQAIRALLVKAGNDGAVVPFHGYYFQILMSQGKNVTSGTRQVSNRKTPGGRFAFVAYPAEYRSTGAMTYLVNQDDVVYEKDLGPDTVQVAKGMTKYNPDSTWHPAE
jgi:Protein of unknown function (DUF2950)